ncbi:MAG TPA: hypothetical protein VG816_04900 [Solirubrobacterales bacterium]|nr:hypothetical protein [Solirubrobacterales bacterium]
MVVSMQLADVGAHSVPKVFRHKPRPADVPGLLYAETVTAAPLGAGLLPTPQPGRMGLLAAWEDDAAFEAFTAQHPLAHRFSNGWQVRLQPLHVYGAWPELPGLPSKEIEVGDEEPVAVLTIGRLRLRRIWPFLKASAGAEGEAVDNPAMLASTGLARPPRLVSTFSIWRDVGTMREYARGHSDGAHPAATRAHRQNSFHHESAFIRFRPYASQGEWDGRNPLARRDSEIARQGRRES